MPKREEWTTTPVDTGACGEPLRRIEASTTVLQIIWDALMHGEATDKEDAAAAIYRVKEAIESDVAELRRVIWQNSRAEFDRRVKKETADVSH